MTAVLFEHADVRDFLDDLESGIVDGDPETLADWLLSRVSDAETERIRLALSAMVADAVAPSRTKRIPIRAARVRDAIGIRNLCVLHRNAWDSVNALLNDPNAAVWRGWGAGVIDARRQARFIRARLHRAWSEA